MIKLNSLVLYKGQPALVLELIGEKYTIEFCSTTSAKNKKISFDTQRVREKDFSLLLDSETVSKGQLSEMATLNLEPTQGDDIVHPLYELLIEEGLLDPMDFNELMDFKGIEGAIDCWRFYKALEISSYFFRVPGESLKFQPYSVEKLEELRQKNEAKLKEQENRQEFILRLKQKKLSLPEDLQQMQDVEALALGKSDKSKTMKECGFSESPEKAHKLLLDTGVWSICRNPHPLRFDLSIHSSTERLASPPQEERVKLNHVAYAIDNAWSTDPDDAIAFDGEWVWIHVADPASSVLPDSLIDISARNRGATLYLPEDTVRMLAEDSLEDYALGLTKESRALSFKIKLDQDGSILETYVLKTLVNVQRLTYEEAEEKKDSEELAPMFQIARRNEERRKKAGAVFINLPEVNISVNNEIVTIQNVTHLESSAVVREFMLLAGEAAAKFAFKNAIPFPFVGQESLAIPKEIPEGLAGQYRLRRCMRSRSVGITPMQHAGLGLGMYSQVTSPLRRYGDLVAHQQLRAFINKSPLLNKDQMLERVAAGDAAAVAATRAERQSRLHWTLVYLLQNKDWQGEAVVLEEKGKQAVCLIPSLGLETILIPSNSFKINDKIIVKSGNINIPALTVNFIPVE